MTGTAYPVPFTPQREEMMPKSRRRTSALPIVGRATVFGAIMRAYLGVNALYLLGVADDKHAEPQP